MTLDMGTAMDFQEGNRVTHPLLGPGAVKKVIDDKYLDIKFDDRQVATVEKKYTTLLCPIFTVEPGVGCLSLCCGCPCP